MEDIGQERWKGSGNGKMKKRKLADLGYQTTASDTEWNSLSPQYFMSNERLTRGRLLKDIGESSNNWRYDLRSNKDYRLRVYQLKCGRDCFPLLDYHCSLANDIATKYEKVKHFLSGTERVVVLPNILQTKELLFTVVTNGEFKEDLPLIVRKQNLDNIKYADITENSYVSNTIQEAKGSSCCLVIEHSGVNLDIQASDILRVSSKTLNKAPRQKDDRAIVSDMTEQDIRRTLTHLLCEPLFSYADQIAMRLKKPSNATSASPDLDGLVEQATLAAHALRNRKDTSRSSRSPETSRIPDDVAMELNKLRTDGVLAFGLFSTGMMVFVDETRQQDRRELEENVKTACARVDKSPRIEFTSKSFLKPSSIKQGDKLKRKSTTEVHVRVGTLGMVTRANVKLRACDVSDVHSSTSKGITPDQQIYNRKGSEGDQTIVAGLTCGHYFNEGDTAAGYMTAPNQNQVDLGTCIASLSPSLDVAVIKIEALDKCSFNFYDEKCRLCNCVALQKDMEIGDAVYKRGAVSDLTKGYIRSHFFRINDSEEALPLCKPEEGYFIEGDGNKVFSEEGDSGSVIFFPDMDDIERETVQIVSIQSSLFKKEAVEKLNLPQNVSYTVRADKCFDKLRDEKKIKLELPTKHDMQ